MRCVWVSRRFAIAAVGIACGCIADQPLHGASEQALAGEARLEISSEASHVPSGGDGAARLELAWVDAAGAREAVQLATPAIAAVAWGEAAVVLDEHRVLWRVAPRAGPERIAGDVVAPPVVSDGRVLAYVVEVGDAGVAVRLREVNGRERNVGTALGAAGLLRFERGRLLFVGARPGGVAGVWSIDLAPGLAAECHTNCELRAGRPWGDAFVPPPRTREELVLP
jgi:hypothetical protein